ncbi:hypothetical protein TNCV_5124571 [Trichonephila clavipes]|nr:hypothetical protein TNCV_5124571 [Trichonephila clavipes]
MRWPSHQIFDWTRPACHLTCPACHLTPVSIVALGWNENFSLGPENSFGGKFEKFDLSSMSLDLSSMSCDPRIKTILGRPLFHWTCPAFHLIPRRSGVE